jgi:hypothetical protein
MIACTRRLAFSGAFLASPCSGCMVDLSHARLGHAVAAQSPTSPPHLSWYYYYLLSNQPLGEVRGTRDSRWSCHCGRKCRGSWDKKHMRARFPLSKLTDLSLISLTLTHTHLSSSFVRKRHRSFYYACTTIT